MTGLEQGLKASKECLDEIRHIVISDGDQLEIGGDQHCAHRAGVERPGLRYQAWIIRCSESRREITRGHDGIERHSQQVQPVISLDVMKEGRRLPRDKGEPHYLAIAQLFERRLRRVVGESDREIEEIEETEGGDCSAAIE